LTFFGAIESTSHKLISSFESLSVCFGFGLCDFIFFTFRDFIYGQFRRIITCNFGCLLYKDVRTWFFSSWRWNNNLALTTSTESKWFRVKVASIWYLVATICFWLLSICILILDFNSFWWFIFNFVIRFTFSGLYRILLTFICSWRLKSRFWRCLRSLWISLTTLRSRFRTNVEKCCFLLFYFVLLWSFFISCPWLRMQMIFWTSLWAIPLRNFPWRQNLGSDFPWRQILGRNFIWR